MEPMLKGLKVLDLSRYISGPFAGMLLGDLGADVIKVEKAGRGDDTRGFVPKINGESVYTFAVNRSKRSVEVNFRTEAGQALLLDLVREADVLIENFRPGTMEKMGCGWDVLHKANPRLIMVSISGFGADGPYRDKPGFDAAIQAMSGLMSVTGDPDGAPMTHGVFTVDHVTAIYAALAILAAYIARERTGEGQLIELSLLECAATLLLCGIPNQAVLGETAQRVGNQDRYLSPGNCYRTADGGYILLIAGSQPHFTLLCEAMGQPGLLEDARFATQAARFEHRDEIDAAVGAWMLRHSTDEAQRILDAHGLVSSRVEDLADVVKNPQLHHRKKLLELQHPVMGKVMMMGMPYRFSGQEWRPERPCPVLGQHNREVLQEWLGLDEEQVERLRQERAITA
ncbi:CaiB/BaiF CoA transferase family protein [Intestinibacillus massiliensis]|uniref:CaiB/BaiF CoA transferase family protein n=1 Tax=Intestinibacillus massiliensis TaxID=1871029 RepID=UPI000B360845|nr:CaiB/BaiF CoA-transferase family protein [Intestinibacillus massiliensis]